ncbi:MAG: hypothetical protein NVS9B10_30650 [Nevskia sp.]
MEFQITDVDYAPEDLYEQVPFDLTLIKELRGPDRPDYWLGSLAKPLLWLDNGITKSITHVMLTPRYVGVRIYPEIQEVTVGIAYVIDNSVLADAVLDLNKCFYAAIGTAHNIGAPNQAYMDSSHKRQEK